jgi:hypothetical protein
MESSTSERVQNEKFETWAIVEIMGRQRFAGFVTEQTLAGQAMLRVDIPKTAKANAFTKFFGGGSIHSLTPTTETIARGLAERLDQAPIAVYDLPLATRQKLGLSDSQVGLLNERLGNVATDEDDDDDLGPHRDDDDDDDEDTDW